MAPRNVICIDEAKCNGCGQCVTGCAEGALAIIDGKARLVKESYCDGLGACIGECPTGALTIEKRDAAGFDPTAVAHHLQKASRKEALSPPPQPSMGCPGMQAHNFTPPPVGMENAQPSQLRHWPIQLHLANPRATVFQGASLLIAADCTAFACGSFHRDLLAGRSLVIACPKLDDPEGYLEKLVLFFTMAQPVSVAVVRMEVPCCSALVSWVVRARDIAGASLSVEEIVIAVTGEEIARRHYSPTPAVTAASENNSPQ